VYALEQKWKELSANVSYPVVFASLATASPAKFADAQQKALGYVLPLPQVSASSRHSHGWWWGES
jgi:threonine synthase